MVGSSSLSWPSLTEYGPFESVETVARRLNITKETLLVYLDAAAERIANAIGVTAPFDFNRDRFRIVDVAGLIRLTPKVHLEVKPKFLGYENEGAWREDFFAIATLVRFGRILPREQLHAGVGEKGDLADLLGHGLVAMYDANRRRPLRVYKQRTWEDFDIDGEVDPESVLIPADKGFSQAGIVLDRRNDFNQVIYQAMGLLLPEIRDRDIRHQLVQRYVDLAPQDAKSANRRAKQSLPHRHKRWQDLYDLSKQVIDGFGIAYDESFRAALPGYILKTSDAWESLIYRAVLSGLKGRHVSKSRYTFAIRQTPSGKGIRTVTPDASINRSSAPPFLLDAKYKARIKADGKEILSVDPADVYESLAFMEATGSDLITLVYPSLGGSFGAPHTGATAVFERIVVGTRTVIAMTVDPRLISETGGFRRFSDQLSATLVEMGA